MSVTGNLENFISFHFSFIALLARNISMFIDAMEWNFIVVFEGNALGNWYFLLCLVVFSSSSNSGIRGTTFFST